MSREFRVITPEEIPGNTFKLVGQDWMLITAGSPASYNTMTASWGGFGVMWGKNICWCVIRPQRYTYEFMERSESFTLTFFDEEHRDALLVCGSQSGRDIDKAAITGLTPVAGDLPGTTYFAEARLVMECRKLYFQDFDPTHFIDPGIDQNYPEKDYHRLYMGEIVRCTVR